jgi:hypothetical protein
MEQNARKYVETCRVARENSETSLRGCWKHISISGSTKQDSKMLKQNNTECAALCGTLSRGFAERAGVHGKSSEDSAISRIASRRHVDTSGASIRSGRKCMWNPKKHMNADGNAKCDDADPATL